MFYISIILIVLNLATLAYLVHRVNHKIKVMEFAVFKIPHLPSYLNHLDKEERLVDDTMGTIN
jgi:hypothetical protein